MHDEALIPAADIRLVDRLWRSGISATAVSPSSRDDLALLQRFLGRNDRGAIVPLLRRHRVATWRLAVAVTMDTDRTAAAVEAAWTEIIDGRHEPISTRANARAWLFAITRRHAVEVGAAPGAQLDLDGDGAPIPLDQTGDIGCVAASFCLLDEPARTAVWLHAVEGFDEADTAHVLGLDRQETREVTELGMRTLRMVAMRAQMSSTGDRCRSVLRHLPDYVADLLDPRTEHELLVHLGRCRRCSTRLDAIEAPGLSLVDRVLAPPTELTNRLRDLASTGSAR
jgi:DNA-directed RNA polymerase specialized sigma24 family protein